MFEKVNPMHPDKIADRIAGALVDLAYSKDDRPRIAVEVLVGHGECNIVAETSVVLNVFDVVNAVRRIAKERLSVNYHEVPQDEALAKNQENAMRCGDNGIFRGAPVTPEQMELSFLARRLYDVYRSDGKYILDNEKVVVCQSNAKKEELYNELKAYEPRRRVIINPLGEWGGGINVDSGATNRKLGSDMGDGVTGGGLHGKDLSKADVAVNIYAFLKAQRLGEKVELSCAIGDEYVDGIPYGEIVDIAAKFIEKLGGFEAFAEWGLF